MKNKINRRRLKRYYRAGLATKKGDGVISKLGVSSLIRMFIYLIRTCFLDEV
jgi:hypothetical protein